MQKSPAPDDLRVFCTVVRKAGFAAAAQELGASPAYVSKRIRLLEAELGVHAAAPHHPPRSGDRSGRARLPLGAAHPGRHGSSAAGGGGPRCEPRGLLRVSSSFGFGRNVVAPALSRLVGQYPGLKVRLEVFDRLVDVAAEGFDLDVRVGDEIAPHLIARRLADNHRVLCAAPTYLARARHAAHPAELPAHDCLVIKERDHPFGVWRLRAGAQGAVAEGNGPLSANHGEMVVQWALDGYGIALRSRWDVQQHLQPGRLVQLLPEWRQEANVWAVYPTRLQLSAKVRVCVEFLQEQFRHRPWANAAHIARGAA